MRWAAPGIRQRARADTVLGSASAVAAGCCSCEWVRLDAEGLMRWVEETAEGRGVRLHVRRVVDPVAPPVLLLHGLGVGGSVWQAFARRLLPYLAAVAPDLRGHGQSEAPPTGYAPADYAGDLIELLANHREHGDSLRAEGGGWLETPLAVVGHSLGALVALELAALRPDLVKWLVLLDPPLDPSLRNPEVAAVSRLRHAPAGELEAYLLGRNPGGGQILAQSLANLFRQASDAAFEAFLPRQDQASPEDRSGTPPRVFATEAFEQASAIKLPCLVLQADPNRGGILGDAAARAFVDRLPNGRLEKIAGATHALHASHPAETARAILAFGGYSSGVDSDSR
jgi:pimeloyl-ACP methyl ester carboxylesterase